MKTWLVGSLALLLSGASAEPTPSVDGVIDRAIEARGGMAKLKAIHSYRITGKAVFGAGNSNVTLAWREVVERPGKIRDELTLQGLTSVDAYDGTDAWSAEPFGGRRDPQRKSADERKNRAQDADLEGPLVDWRQKGHQVEYLGREDVDGTLAHKLRVRLKDGDTVYIFLDPDYFLELGEETHRHLRGTEEITETDFGNYQQVSGVWFAFSSSSGPPGQAHHAHFTIEQLEPNVVVDDSLFRFPAPGTPIGAAIPAPASPVTNATTAAPHPPARSSSAVTSSVISGLGARNIGSAAMSGRIAALAATTHDGATTLFVGAASGGVWRSTDDGTNFKPVFDKQLVQSVGAVTIDPNNPKIIWVGTGEAWTRNSVSIGDGIYKSTDGGDTWKNMGLPKSERIARILVNPKDSAVVYACVPGKLWSDSPDRGVYLTRDGGATWTLILRGKNLSTGCSGLAMDPKNPNVLFAGLWDFRRKGWTFRSGGETPTSPSGSALFTTADAGKSWTELTPRTNPGIPPKPWGRVEVQVAPSDGKVVYALIESTDSALYRSPDGGRTWERRDNSQSVVWRPFYFARLVVDPKNPNRLFKPDLSLVVSDDGGKSFSYSGGASHGDWHDLWIDPSNPKHVIGGDDGGLWFSWDGGTRWWKAQNLPISQFYHVAVDDRDPYQVYGGLQDNSSWVGDSSYPGGIDNSRWENLYDGDGFWAVVDPTDSHAVYAESQGGYIGRIDRITRAHRSIQPLAGYHEKLRFNWNTPIAVSPNDKNTLYIGAQFLFRSRDRGDSWERISPDLSTRDPEKQKQEQSGGVTVDNSSAEMHTTLYSISESPRDPQLIWVGTDDGNLQLTRNGGQTWTNLAKNVKGLPANSWVSWVEASRFEPAVAYATFDRHTFGDMDAWIYRTSDFGKTWTRIGGPAEHIRGYAHVIKEDPVKPELLYAGTEFGLWISLDRGRTWAEFKGGEFPCVAVRDLQIHPREHDLVIATHGRGLWIIDDISPLRALSPELLQKTVALLPGRPIQQRMSGVGGWVHGDAAYEGRNAEGDATFTYFQSTRHLFGPMHFEILDDRGKVLDSLPPSEHAGLNRVVWTMRAKPPQVPRAASVAFSASEGPRYPAGKFIARLTRGTEVVELPFEVSVDRRAPYGSTERRENFDAAMRVHALFGEMSGLTRRIESTQQSLNMRSKGLAPHDRLVKSLSTLGEHLQELRKKIVATKEGGAITGEERIREHTDMLYGDLLGWEGRPARYQLERIDVLHRELSDVSQALDRLVQRELAPLNQTLKARHLEPISLAQPEGVDGREASLWGQCTSASRAGCPLKLEDDARLSAEERD